MTNSKITSTTSSTGNTTFISIISWLNVFCPIYYNRSNLYDRRIVAFEIGDSNNNELVFSTFDEAVRLNPDAHPIFHSDRGFQYTSKVFHQKLVNAGMIQSMSRVGRCIDNDPMEGWWGILKSEMYYLRKFTDKASLIAAIEEYIRYYNTGRYQLKLNSMTPMEYHEVYAA